MSGWKDEVQDCAEQLASLAERLQRLLVEPETQAGPWVFPVGSVEAPIQDWYCAQYHTYKGGNAGHTGLDLNLDRAPWGDVDRGQPVWAVTTGTVHSVGTSKGWVHVVVIKVQHAGKPLWVRYAHLDPGGVQLQVGQAVKAGTRLGRIGNYVAGRGGDHVHFDMALDSFQWFHWRTPDIRWVDPIPILNAHLAPEMVTKLLAKGD